LGLILFPRSLVIALFAGVMGFALGGSIVAALQEPVVHNQTQPTKAEGQYSHSSTSPDGSNQTEKRNQESHWYDTFFDHPTDWLLVLFNGILAAFTVRLFYAATEQSRDMKNSLAISDAAAKAAQKSAQTAEDAFTKLERPYIFIFGAGKFEPDPDGFEVKAFVRYRVANHGKTPAIIENVRATIDTSSTGFPICPLRVEEDHELFRISIVASEHNYNLRQPDWSDTKYYVDKARIWPEDLGQNELFFLGHHQLSRCLHQRTREQRLLALRWGDR